MKLNTIMRAFLMLCEILCIYLWWSCQNCDVIFCIEL